MRAFHKSLLLLLVFAVGGQGLLANALPCQMPPDTLAAPHADAMAGMDHTVHRMPAVAADAAGSGDECCHSGECSMSHCQSSLVLPLSMLASRPDLSREFSRPTTARAPARIVSSLFRPPISR